MTRGTAFVSPDLHRSAPQRREGNGALPRIIKRDRLSPSRVNKVNGICVSALFRDGGAHEA